MYLQHPNAFGYPHKLCLTHRHLNIQIVDLINCCVLRLGSWENQPAAMLCSHSEAKCEVATQVLQVAVNMTHASKLDRGCKEFLDTWPRFDQQRHLFERNPHLLWFAVKQTCPPFLAAVSPTTANKETIKPTEAALDISSNFFFKSSIWPADSRLHPPRLLYPFLFLQGSFTNDPSWFSFPNCYWQISKKKNTGCLTLSELCFNLAGDNLSACENAKKNADNVMTFGLQVSYSLKGNSHCLGSTRIFPSVKCHQRNLWGYEESDACPLPAKKLTRNQQPSVARWPASYSCFLLNLFITRT